MRNVVQTIVGLPEQFSNRCELFINDIDDDIVARNIILLLTACCFDTQSAAEAMIHIWYSALLPPWIVTGLEEKVLPLIKDACSKAQETPKSARLGMTWKFMSSKVQVVLTKQQWHHLLEYFLVPSALSSTKANEIRRATTLAPHRVDHQDRNWCAQPPAWRVAKHKFRKDGILLPFGNSRKNFTVPNP